MQSQYSGNGGGRHQCGSGGGPKRRSQRKRRTKVRSVEGLLDGDDNDLADGHGIKVETEDLRLTSRL